MSIELLRAAEIRGALNTPGWRRIKAAAVELLKKREQAVILCDDDARVLRLQHTANGAAEFWNELERLIQAAASAEASDVQGVNI